MNTFTRLESFSPDQLKPTKKTKTAGLVVLAEDTGRVLMLQRHSSDTGKAAGKWEFPGGHVEQDEAHHEAAIREWEEETGIHFPTNGKWGDLHWISPNKKYIGFVYRIPHEADITINPAKTRRLQNPDDPKKENIETVAWFSPADLKDNPLVREECHATPWHILSAGNPEALIDWYNSGADGQIAWGEPGDFDQCVSIASKYIDDAEGFCQLRHIDATGEATATHAKEEKVTNSFTLLEFYNENHDEHGRFSPKEEEGGDHFYHGTDEEFKPGDKVLPQSQTGNKKFFYADPKRADNVYITDSKESARYYGKHVYEVDPSSLRVDPEEENSYMAPSAKIIKKLSTYTNSFSRLEEFYNENHDERGRFTEGEGAAQGDKEPKKVDSTSDSTSAPVAHFGFERWPAARRNEILNQVAALRDKYPVEGTAIMSVNAGGNFRTNVAIQVQALAAVEDSTPTHIDINPGMKSWKWVEKNDPGTTVSTGSLKDIITHEFGHVIEGTLPSRLRTQLTEPFIKAQESLFDLEDGKGDGALFKNLTTKVSEYAGDNVSEGIAEAFLQHEKGIHNEYSDHVGAILAKWKAGAK